MPIATYEENTAILFQPWNYMKQLHYITMQVAKGQNLIQLLLEKAIDSNARDVISQASFKKRLLSKWSLTAALMNALRQGVKLPVMIVLSY
jgi:phosphatidylserine/phosphatidylglycerophosphate/cardiolipin synthase-like enzyme